jgi:hypothetical protein
MNITEIDSQKIKKVTISNLKSYLNSKGWITNNDVVLEKNIFYTGPLSDDGTPIQITIPKNDSYIDYQDRLIDAINLLSCIYDKSLADIINEITSCYTDILNTRVIDTGVFSNSLSLDEALREITGIKSLLAYSASSEVIAKKHFDQPHSKGSKFVEKCRFAHTFHGSFGFSVEVPIIQENEGQHLFDIPFERKVCERIARGLMFLDYSVQTDNADYLVEQSDTAFNSKMCDALLNISNQSNKEVELGFNWSYQIPLSNDLKEFRSIILKERHYEIASYVSERLKEVEPEEVLLSGRIIDLHCSIDPKQDKANRHIILKHLNSDNESRDIKALLNLAYYEKACNAHSKGHDISINGVLSRNKSGWVLNDIKHLELAT